jgi:hypothetical protein
MLAISKDICIINHEVIISSRCALSSEDNFDKTSLAKISAWILEGGCIFKKSFNWFIHRSNITLESAKTSFSSTIFHPSNSFEASIT